MPRKKTADVPTSISSLSAVPKPRAPRATKPKVAKAARAAPDAPTPTYEEIAEAAYLRFLSRGGNHGGDFDDWVEAERELSARRGYAKAG